MGNLINNINGALKIQHGRGTIEFNVRNPDKIRNLGARTILIIEGLGEIPKNAIIKIDLSNDDAVTFVQPETVPR